MLIEEPGPVGEYFAGALAVSAMRTLALRAHRPQIDGGKDSSAQRHKQEAGGTLPLLPICCRSQRQIQSNPFLLAEVCLVDPVNPAPIPLNSALKYVYHIQVDNKGDECHDTKHISCKISSTKVRA